MNYLTVTARVELPPPLLLTVMFTGLVATERVASYLPPPLFASVPSTTPVEVVETVMVTVVLLLVASTRSVFLLGSGPRPFALPPCAVTGGAGGIDSKSSGLDHTGCVCAERDRCGYRDRASGYAESGRSRAGLESRPLQGPSLLRDCYSSEWRRCPLRARCR